MNISLDRPSQVILEPPRNPIPRHPIFDHLKLGVSPEKLKSVGAALAINEALPDLDLLEPTAMMLDINNLFLRTKGEHWSIDYVKLKNLFSQRCDLRYCAAFSALDRQSPSSVGWAKYMSEQGGYDVQAKDLKRYTNEKGDLVTKGNMDVEITLACRDLSESFAHVILGSCDGDFVPLVNRLKKGGFKKVSVLGVSNKEGTGMSSSLIKAADNFYDLTKLKEYVEYRRV